MEQKGIPVAAQPVADTTEPDVRRVSQQPAGFIEHSVQDGIHLVELGLTTDQRWRELDHRVAAIIGAVAGFVLRGLAIRYNIALPAYRGGGRTED